MDTNTSEKKDITNPMDLTVKSVSIQIAELINTLKQNSSSEEDGRIKSIVITKLQEALLFSEQILNTRLELKNKYLLIFIK